MLRTDLIRPLSETLIEHAAVRGDQLAFSDGRRSVSYADLESRTRRIAGHLAELRIQPGDRVAIFLNNSVEMVESYFAITRASAIGVPLNPHSTDAELGYALADSAARAVITDPAHAEQAARQLAESKSARLIVTGKRDIPAGAVSFEALASIEPAQPARDDMELDDVAWMLYTSGTTGRPKGVLSTQRNCLWSVAACYVPVLNLSPADRVLWPLPLYHSLSHIAGVLATTAVGAGVRIVDGYSGEELLSALAAESPTVLAGVPTMYHHLVRAGRQHGLTESRLRVGLVGGAVTNASLRSAFEQTFGVPLVDAYGSTETCGSITVNWPTGARVEGSCGLPVPGLNVRLVSPDTGQDVPAGEEGEVWVSGPSVMVGYHNRPAETAAALRDGWYRTGDLARRDDAGYFTITGRIKELIIRGGENIHPNEIEDVLRDVPGINDVAVAGKPHEILGEVPVAFVVPGPAGFDSEALFAACRERLAYYKVPEEIYEISRIPRTRSGKITRHVLLDSPARLRAAGINSYESLLRLDWIPLPVCGGPDQRSVGRWALVGNAEQALPAGLEAAGIELTEYSDLAQLIERIDAGSAVPDAVLLCQPTDQDADPLAIAEASAALAEQLRGWRAADPDGDARLALLTRNGVAINNDEPCDPGQAALAGLARAGHLTYGMVQLDVDRFDAATGAVLPRAMAAGEPELVIRAGSLLRPSLERVSIDQDGRKLDWTRTALVVGAETPAGASLAKHLAMGRGIRRLALLSELGADDPAIALLKKEIAKSGCRVTVLAGDPADRASLARALAGVVRSLGVIVYAPDATASLATVLRTAGNLDEVTADARLSGFVTIYSAAALLRRTDNLEQAAVAGYLEGFASRRRQHKLPALALAVGPWQDEPWPAAGPDAGVPLAGVSTMSRRELPAAFDAALLTDESTLVALKLDATALYGNSVPAVLRSLIDTASSGSTADDGRASQLREDLLALPAAEQLARVLALICTEAATIGGVDDREVPADRPFKELGFTSVQAVRLRNHLVRATGLSLPATIAFDYPTPRVLAGFVVAELLGVGSVVGDGPVVGSVVDPSVDPVVIVGMACRLPGGIDSPEDLWEFVRQGLDGITEFPTDRGWDIEGIYDPDPDQRGKSYVRTGGFLSDATGFDADFFRISPREALAMDPQQRVFLEAAWEVFERAGIDVGSLRGSRTGVFAGVMNQEYGTALSAAGDDDTEGYQSIGSASSGTVR